MNITPATLGIIMLCTMFVLMMLRIPVSISMAVPSILGITLLKGWSALMVAVQQNVWTTSTLYGYSVIPMFVVMGEFLFVSGIATELFDCFRAWFGRIRGGQALATIAASAVFAAASGSSWATAATIGTITADEMLDSGYGKPLVGGSVAAGGTLGILIPPSTVLVLYGMLTNASVGKLLIAGLVPGIILALLYMLTIKAMVWADPRAAPAGVKHSWHEKLTTLRGIASVLILFIVVIGGMYIGFFSPTEAAGFGAISAMIIGLVRRKLDGKKIIEACLSTCKTLGFIFALTMAAYLLNFFLALTRVPTLLVNAIISLNFGKLGTFCLIIFLYFILGMFLDTMSIIIITVPLMVPIVTVFGWDLVWFGVVLTIMIECALITPPVGSCCFILHNVCPRLELSEIFRGSIRFVFAIICLIILLYSFPQLALYLPSHMV